MNHIIGVSQFKNHDFDAIIALSIKDGKKLVSRTRIGEGDKLITTLVVFHNGIEKFETNSLVWAFETYNNY